MRYQYGRGVKKESSRKKPLVFFALLLFVIGGYVLVSSLAPLVPADMTGESTVITKKLTEQQPVLKENRLYVPQIGVDVAIVTGVNENTLEGGAWHRVPEQGDPKKGNNFILAAHRFNLGLTPTQTRAKSPFFYIDRINQGQKIYVDFDGTRYAYEVTRHYKVADNDTSIEASTKEARLTLYSCDIRGPKAGREVIEAKPIGAVAWSDGKPVIKTDL